MTGPQQGAPRVSVLMPIFEAEHFVPRAIASLRAGDLADWELLVVDDGSRDATPAAIDEARAGDRRIRVLRLPDNRGLGAALNVGLNQAGAPLIAYLPADDLFHRDHLSRLVAVLDADPGAVLAFAGMRHSYNREALEPLPDGLQLVQVAHRRTTDRWVERAELESDDLERLFWGRLGARGARVATGHVSCEWVSHPGQRHRLMREPIGGINPFRQRYGVRQPLRFHSTHGDAIDEPVRYGRFRDRPDTRPAPDGLHIVLAGELAYNPERVLALEERGHRLSGLWMPEPYWYNAVGPQPFGHVADLDARNLRASLRAARPDVVLGLLNWQAVPFAAEVRSAAASLGIPFVWHFKEGPFICLEQGTWPALMELVTRSDGVIHSSEELGRWFDLAVPGGLDPARTLVLDGDLPKADWLAGARTPRLSERDGEIHTVVPGRPIGLHPQDVEALARKDIHLHFYGDFTQGQWRDWISTSSARAPGHLHLHPTVHQDRWVTELSRYDAGWLHVFRSRNGGDIARADWDDLNLPARMATLAMAGLPMLQGDNRGSIVAAHRLVQEGGLGVAFTDHEDLADQLADRTRLRAIGERVWSERGTFTFDAHADRLVAFLRRIIGLPRADMEGVATAVRVPMDMAAPMSVTTEPIAAPHR